MAVRGAGPITGLILGSILAAGGFMVAFWLGKPIRDQAVASSSWSTTEGRIVRSKLEESRKDGKVHYSADIGYEYDLDGRTLTGTRVWIGDGYSSSPGNEFRAAVDRYPAGRQVKVHYDPADPAESVLEPGPTWSSSLAYLIGLGMLGVGSLVLISALAPLLLVAVALAGSGGPRHRDDMRDFDGSPPRPSFGDRGQRPEPPRGDDDGITIG
jgi:hypothetical protein